ncbi:uncharacterized protein ZMO1_ZMO1129 [Zymomonas mobilis subsp. mobilis ZM4 = ATCC 31821]|uniref:Uncharacterized protein n=2 Tax=Zymomonas mobilis TaxID=542 RepID=D2YW30_ZYMMO|nr:hypothetical protein [Zymomonas mobilis]AAV89753.2 hypothetical protein ZMO1129 [Zymomonas mobilis subsp. mobilis ZM4 = ATCC 31821]AVZ26016.1 hypothetical protein ZMO2_ZMO1129 [Zymomonas mobilis subsp. mobilis]AVZ27907.1 hypothetical protein ZMO3_ZMO1129 [Zymomonas mobilis subsp. mobilis]AVZ42354.1 uncharacterized protein ZMO1_ZMO1129 [Zymomonas mobilis subsp. mobilis ZM4 = ATCC 31821]UBQ07126.1 hypothetical protein LB319_05770 [Zymomonas mobilis]
MLISYSMNPVIRHSIALVACMVGTGAMAAATEAAGSQSQCMTHAEAQALMETALPGLLQGAKQQCSSVLDSDSYLLKQEATLSKRFRQESETDWPKAKAAFERLGGSAVADMGDAGKRAAIETMVSDIVSQKMKPQSCEIVNGFLPFVAEQPANKIGDVSVSTFALLKKIGKVGRILPFDICSGD